MFLSFLLGPVVLIDANLTVYRLGVGRVYDQASNLPEEGSVGLVLGTVPVMRSGRANLYYKYRMEAAAELYHLGKVKHLIVSGGNPTQKYDEATAMAKSLVELGVPASAITKDYAGYRTLDSIVRCKKVFGQEKVVIISQEYHNVRAIFLARCNGLSAVGYNARQVGDWPTPPREYLARVRAVWDIITFTKPKYLGDLVPLNEG